MDAPSSLRPGDIKRPKPWFTDDLPAIVAIRRMRSPRHVGWQRLNDLLGEAELVYERGLAPGVGDLGSGDGAVGRDNKLVQSTDRKVSIWKVSASIESIVKGSFYLRRPVVASESPPETEEPSATLLVQGLASIARRSFHNRPMSKNALVAVKVQDVFWDEYDATVPASRGIGVRKWSALESAYRDQTLNVRAVATCIRVL